MSKRTQRRAEQRRNNRLEREQNEAAKPMNPAAQSIQETPLASAELKTARTGSSCSGSSDAQIAANRENARLSTGPTSDAGKAAVSQNRTTHGLNYNPETFRVLACEDQAQYDSLLDSLVTEQKPTGITETLLVAAMAQHRWLLDRANRLQETCFDQQTAQITDQKLFALYLRYATTHERAFHKCLGDLLKLRNQKINEQIGFESEKRKADQHQSFLQNAKYDQQIKGVKSRLAEYHAARQIEADQNRKSARQAS